MVRPTETVTAWAPWSETVSISRAAETAAAWLQVQAKAQGLSPLLVTIDQGTWRGAGPAIVERWAKVDAVSLRGKGPKQRGPHAVLCYAPNYKTVDRALDYADGGAIAIVEWPSDRLIGWAMATGAINLDTGESAPAFDAETLELLEFVSFNGNNGWTRGYGQENALRAIADFGWIETNLVCGYLLAQGHHAESVERLRTLLNRR